MQSLRGTLNVIRPHLPEALVSTAAFADIAATVDHLPAAVTRDIYFECRLGDHASRTDVVLGVYDFGRSLLADAGLRNLANDAGSGSNWSRVRAFCREWQNPGSALNGLIDHVWLEYDVRRSAAAGKNDGTATSCPSLFISFRQLAEGTPQGTCHAVRSFSEACRCVTNDTVIATMLRCLNNLPRTADLEYVGLMLGRPQATMRLCAMGMPTDAVIEYLAAMAGARADELAAVTRSVSAHHAPDGISRVGMLHLDIDSRRGLLPRIGMERTFARPCQVHGHLAVDDLRFLDYLTASGLCSGAKREALTEWPGRTVAIVPHEFRWSLVNRRINHVKLVVVPPGTIEAKAYLFSTLRAPGRTRTDTQPVALRQSMEGAHP